MPIILDGTLGITTPALTVTGATVNTGGISTAGNLTFSSTGQRIIGDFSNTTTIASRVIVQTSTTNGNTIFSLLPNGTAVTSSLDVYNSSDTLNHTRFRFLINSTENRLGDTIVGTGSYLPMTFYTGGSERMRIDTSGNVMVGTTVQLRSGLVTSAGSSSTINQLVLADTNAYNTSPAAQQTFSTKFNSSGTYVDTAYIRAGKSNATDGNSLGYLAFATNTGAAAVEAMRIDSSGNVGIGTSSPATKLQVSGTTRLDGNVESNTAQYIYSWAGGSTGSVRSGVYLDGTNQVLQLLTGTNERFRIGSAGQLGIAGANYGSSGQILTSGGSGAAPTWSGLPAGSIAQVITVNKTNTFASSTGNTTTWQDVTDLTITITPRNASSRFLVMAMLQVGKTSFSSYWRVVRDGNATFIGDTAGNRPRTTFAAMPTDETNSSQHISASGMTWIDSPATTSAVTYKIQCQQQADFRIAYLNRSGSDRNEPTYDPRTASSFTVMEILG